MSLGRDEVVPVEYRLLEKTELWISPVELAGADLGACAQAAAQALGLNPDEIMVTDVLEDRLTLDILVPTIQAEQIVAREGALLGALAAVPGVRITPETSVHSDGILGLISLDEKAGQDVLGRSVAMGNQIAEHIRKRTMIFATGQEVLGGQIRDTNTPFLTRMLEAEGYVVARGPTMEDKAGRISRAFRQAAEDGYGLLITTGGIGAEGKDQTLEALVQVDPHARTPYILKFQRGQGRHQKDGVRIGVGILGQTLIVCLPGPHDEVKLVWSPLRKGLKANWTKEVLAETLAKTLRGKFLARSQHHATRAQDKRAEVLHGSK
jgi:molybdenum cofactor synthesis domain-containing protein